MKKFDEVYNRIISQMKQNFKYDINQEVYVLINNNPQKGIIKDRRFNGSRQEYYISIDGNKAAPYLIQQLGRSIEQAIENSKQNEKEIETEDGEGAVAIGGGAGMTTNDVFGPPGSQPSVVPHQQKTAKDPGVCTKDISELYTPHKGTQVIGTFKRVKKN